MSRLRRVGAVLAVNLLVFGVLLAVAELLFGDWFAGNEDISMLNVRPNTIDIRPSPLYPPGTMITYSRDKFGFRAGSSDAARTDVLAIGGSTTNERLVDDDDLWTVQLQHRLDRRGCTVTIANTGMDGYTTLAHIASFEQWFNRIPGLKPRFALVYVGINDALLDPSALPSGNPQKYSSWWRRAEHYIAARSAVRRLFVTLRGWWQARRANVLHGEIPVTPQSAWEPASLPADFVAKSAAKDAGYYQRLEHLNRLIHGFGAIPIYVTQARADGRKVDGTWQRIVGSNGALDAAYLQGIDSTTLQFCRDKGETCIDLAQEIDFEPGDFYDAVHNTLSGSHRIADFLVPRLAPMLCPGQ